MIIIIMAGSSPRPLALDLALALTLGLDDVAVIMAGSPGTNALMNRGATESRASPDESGECHCPSGRTLLPLFRVFLLSKTVQQSLKSLINCNK
jgi:hypothetical protein